MEGEGERGEYIELAIEPPAPLQLCPPDRRHPRAAREQWKLPGDAFPLCCWTTEPDGHSQSLPKGIHQNNSTLFADVWRQIHYRFFLQSAKQFIFYVNFASHLPERDPPTPTCCYLMFPIAQSPLPIQPIVQMYHQEQNHHLFDNQE